MMEEPVKKQIHSGKIGGYLVIMNLIVIIMFLAITKLINIDSILIKGIILAFFGAILNLFGAKYLLTKNVITDGISEVKKNLLLSFLFVTVAFVAFGVIGFNLDKNSRFIQVSPSVNYSEEIKAMIHDQSKYAVSFGPPIKLFSTGEETAENIQKLQKDIKSKEEKIDNELKENKVSWIILITIYAGFSLIGTILVLYNINKWYIPEFITESVNHPGIALNILIISILGILISVATVIFVSQRSVNGLSDNVVLAEGKTKGSILPITEMLKIGDYVEYIPDSTTYLADADNTGYNKAQELKTAYGTWEVFDIDESTGSVFITTSTMFTDSVYLEGIKGFLNGPTELNNICTALYSNKSLGVTARSMTREDVNKACGYVASEKTSRYAFYPYGTKLSGDKDIVYNGNTYLKRVLRDSSPHYFYTCDGGGKKLNDSNEVTYYKPTEDNPVLITDTSYIYQLESYNSTVRSVLGRMSGWLASSCVSAGYGAGFSVCIADSNRVTNTTLVDTSGVENKSSHAIRPIVVLDSTIEIDNSDTTRDGKTFKTAWKIRKK